MDIQDNMLFEIKEGFIPNLSKSDSLRILEVTPRSVIARLNNSVNRVVFPVDNFQYWIRRGALISIQEDEQISS